MPRTYKTIAGLNRSLKQAIAQLNDFEPDSLWKDDYIRKYWDGRLEDFLRALSVPWSNPGDVTWAEEMRKLLVEAFAKASGWNNNHDAC